MLTGGQFSRVEALAGLLDGIRRSIQGGGSREVADGLLAEVDE